MNLATLRVEGPDESLCQLKKLLGLDPDVEWHAGERTRNGGIRESSGFNSTIADEKTAEDMTERVHDFLNRCTSAQVSFPWRGVNGGIDVGFDIGSSERFAGGFRLSPTCIQAWAKCGLSLITTAYPTSDE